jgi:hypothetical protein
MTSTIEQPKEDPALLIYWAEAMLPHPQDKILNLKSSREYEFVYNYLKSELAGFDNTNYKEDFFNLMINKYNFKKEDLEKRLNNIKETAKKRNN